MSDLTRRFSPGAGTPDARFDVVGIGNALVDVIAPAEEHFLDRYELVKGSMTLIETERAVELYALAARYPYISNSRWFEDVVGREVRAAAETLAPEVRAAAEERGRARDLDATVEELLAELATEGA